MAASPAQEWIGGGNKRAVQIKIAAGSLISVEKIKLSMIRCSNHCRIDTLIRVIDLTELEILSQPGACR
jgi:hypothetical protein